MSVMPNGTVISLRQAGWIKPHIFNLRRWGGPSIFLCFNDYPAGRELGRAEGFGKTMRESYQAWIDNGGKTGGFQ